MPFWCCAECVHATCILLFYARKYKMNKLLTHTSGLLKSYMQI